MAEVDKKDEDMQEVNPNDGAAELGGLDDDGEDTLILVSSDDNPKNLKLVKKLH